MSATENNARRVRLVLELLADHPEGLPKTAGPEAVFPQVFSQVPQEEHEAELLPSGLSRAEATLTWSSVDLVKAGWLKKSGRGLWEITPDGRQALEDYPDAPTLVTEARNRYNAWNALSSERKNEQLRTTIVAVDKDEEAVRLAALPFVERGLQDGDSVFAPGRAIWATGPLDELRSVFVDAPDPEAGNFVEKLEVQLAHASDDARLLMAELVCWQLLPISPGAIGERAKKERVQTLLGYMDHPVQIPTEVSKAFKSGSFNPGTAMSNNLYAALVMIIGLLDGWLRQTEAEKERLLGDAWAWRDFVNDLPGHRFPTQRNTLSYIVHPQRISSIVSEKHKLAIRAAFVGEISADTTDVDRDLLAIILKLQQKTGGPVDFYEEPFAHAWNQQPAPDTEPDPEPDAEPPAAETARSGQRRPFPPADAELADSLFFDRGWLQKQLDLLERRGQVILYGPPGTGKTFVAMKLAEHVAGADEYTEIVQFHPSYSYEDFFQGYRPATTAAGSLTYELKDGPLRRIVDQALKNPEFNYVLVIDEINRGNLAKIFGELYFLLEYRDRPIKLQYSKDDEDSFVLPANLFLIGTMNTSDRSIALLDAAMRRRFSFVELHPDKHPTKTVLARWLDHHDLDGEPAALLAAVNGKIGASDFRIGPSYLMPKGDRFRPGQLEDIWEYDILPLLTEHHYGERIDVEKTYGLKALRAQLDTPPPAAPGPPDPVAG
ncbi:AAA family ATPase [Arthrobacter halodurans]|uniref:AAA family ATPase n=1 Tax=Arthrobacter halodurans TaxID=516699 RepID=A0ABV4UQW3_9MICC